jgi:hypothetical protein
MMGELIRVSDLREAIKDRGDDEIVHCQLIFGNGKAWNMQGRYGPIFGFDRGVVLSFSHPDLQDAIVAAK